ncbi:hypothetical protein D7V93_08415 [Corallococcus llansteffanensis]|uniref:DUF4403 family protein n=2 Tax=Corallococcus llansteffanensis TaxID=2316731 RepID=A0A3A8Q9J6_9BACT|nr:hypothetical protein D7V93_08415 [Corallococcus llansteffanensis]
MMPLLASAHDGSLFHLQFDKELPAGHQEQMRQWLQCRAEKLFMTDVTYAWPETGEHIVLSLPRQSPQVLVESPQAVSVRIPGGIVALVGLKEPPPLPPGLWSQPADGGLRVHGFIDPAVLSLAISKHLQGSIFKLLKGSSRMQSLTLSTQDTQLVLIARLIGGNNLQGLLVIRGTPRFAMENGSVRMKVDDVAVTYNDEPDGLLQAAIQNQRLWNLDGELATVAKKAEAFFESQLSPDARAEVKPRQDLRLKVAQGLLHFSFSLDVTLTYKSTQK